MTVQTLLDFDRRDKNLSESKIREILPSYFLSEYPDLVTFLEKYYDFMDSDQTYGFDNNIQNLYKIRDLQETDISLLNKIFEEIGQGKVTSDYFTDPRYVATLLSRFYKVKGTITSAEGFFRAFYNEQPTIEYPKKDLFTVGSSQIGAESLKYIQDGAKYQVLSVNIKSATPITKWRDLYKSFVHPAGFYLGGEVSIESLGNLNLGNMPLSIEDSAAGTIIIPTAASIAPTGFASLTGILPDTLDADSYDERIDLNMIISKYQTVTVEQLDDMYDNSLDAVSANNQRFDRDSSVGVRFDNTIETMDGSIFDNFNPIHYIDSV